MPLMTRALIALGTATTLTGGLVLAATDAGAATHPATSTTHHVSVSLPSRSVTHRRTATISAAIAVARGAKEHVTGSRVAAYQHGRRVAQGRSVHLRPGTYRIAATVSYRAVRTVTVHHTTTVRTVHPGGYPAADCRVTSVSSSRHDDIFDTIGTAVCTSASYPGRTSHVIGEDLSRWPQHDDTSYYRVGEHLRTHQARFASYTTTSTHVVSHRVKRAGPTKRFTTPRSTLVVVRK